MSRHPPPPPGRDQEIERRYRGGQTTGPIAKAMGLAETVVSSAIERRIPEEDRQRIAARPKEMRAAQKQADRREARAMAPGSSWDKQVRESAKNADAVISEGRNLRKEPLPDCWLED